jgi:transcriptional regulator with XRE-family HTH domain
VLRLRLEAGLSARQVAASLQMARSSVKDYERRLSLQSISSHCR